MKGGFGKIDLVERGCAPTLAFGMAIFFVYSLGACLKSEKKVCLDTKGNPIVVCPGSMECAGNGTPTCVPKGCLNGIRERLEECDDGLETVACNLNCTFRRCGDGIINKTAGEECDDGLQNTDLRVCPEGENSCKLCDTQCHLVQILPECSEGTISNGAPCFAQSAIVCCDHACTDISTDPRNCSSCGSPCSAPENATPACASGMCDFACKAGYTRCGEKCVATNLLCGNSCQICQPTLSDNCNSGVCMCGTNAACSGEETCCGGECTNKKSDKNNCSACGHACTAPANATAACRSGACDYDCQAGLIRCTDGCSTESMTRCGSTCQDCTSAGGSCCGGVCSDKQSDKSNCGRCGKHCLYGDTCVGAQCAADLAWANWRVPPDAPTNYYDGLEGQTVTDLVTGLVWQKVVPETPCGSSAYCTWDQAKAYCENLSLAGQTDWRLPTRIELVSIVDSSKINPAINGSAFPNTPVDYFWTSTPDAGDSGYAWIVNFGLGHMSIYYTTGTSRVRCVH